MVHVIAHRGFSGRYPENTLLSISKALEAGAHGVEIDIRMTKDRKLVLFHNKTLRWGFGVRRKISGKTWAELQKQKVHGEPIPLLEDILRFLKKAGAEPIFLDMKIANCVKELAHAIKKTRTKERIIVCSSNGGFMEKLKSLIPETKFAYGMDNRPDKLRTWRKIHGKIGLFSINIYNKRPLSTGRIIRKAKDRNLKAYAWFVRHSRNFKRMEELVFMGVDGVITDYPDEVLKRFRRIKNLFS